MSNLYVNSQQLIHYFQGEYEEAIKRIVAYKDIQIQNDPLAVYVIEAVDIAIKSLQKQIPTQAISYTTEYTCPSCGCEVDEKAHHCLCGQALDWRGVIK